MTCSSQVCPLGWAFYLGCKSASLRNLRRNSPEFLLRFRTWLGLVPESSYGCQRSPKDRGARNPLRDPGTQPSVFGIFLRVCKHAQGHSVDTCEVNQQTVPRQFQHYLHKHRQAWEKLLFGERAQDILSLLI